ncbi:MAG: pyridoxal phosphate-dependent aminotransferase, partial [Chloroflexi bacterium]|nr:pyridoxal phosphate-dependent aminotransferase [Chloroflexota bacterium]
MVIANEIRRGMEDSSWIRRMFELGIELRRERGAENVFDLSLGNPITEPPPEFFDELRRYTAGDHPGAHRYMPNPGYVETRQAVADALSDETGLSY